MGWALVQAPTQFQGSGSFHLLAAVLFTDRIQFSIYTTRKPVFALLLDAKSAFDKVVKECAIRNAYLAGTCDQGLLYLDSRLDSRRTFVEWDKVLMGPIDDKLGVEQGGVNSDRIYKLCNNVQLNTVQRSGLGVNLGDVVVSSIGQADDTVLISDCIVKLYGLLHLAVSYCKQYHVELVPEKTKLVAFCHNPKSTSMYFQKLLNPISIEGHKVEFSSSAEHVGIIRSSEGNMPNILHRLSCHTKAIASVLPAGLSRAHRGNPASSLRIESIYGCPVLLSGLPSLVLNSLEESIIHHHYKVSLQRLQRLHQGTPEAVVMFLAGSLPATALRHLRMLGLLAMIARLDPQNILHRHGRHVLLNPDKKDLRWSWFASVRLLSQQYGLPDPILVLKSPPTHYYWKKLTKLKALIYVSLHHSSFVDHCE